MTVLLERAGELIWGPWTAAAVLAAGIWLSQCTGWPQIRDIKTWWKATAGSLTSRRKGDGISPFQSATAALAGSLGTGNIVGVAVAISAGGAGAIFWMWLAAIPSMAVAYAENTLGMHYRRRQADGHWLGGPMVYMSRGLGAGKTAAVWAFVCSLAALCIGNLVQVNSISAAAREAWNLPELPVGIVLVACAAPAILGGARSVTRMTTRLVPVMAIAYIGACIAVIVLHLHRLPSSLMRILQEAFRPEAAGGGMLGAMLTGIRRGVFTHEAGMGTSVLIHCTAETEHPEEQGYWAMFEVFLDTIVMCSLTALAILVSGADTRAQGSAMTAEAFRTVFGAAADSFSASATLLFAFATVIGWSCCGEQAFSYLFGPRAARLYRAAYVTLIVPGCIMNTGAVWAASDILNALLMLPNLAAVILLLRRDRHALPPQLPPE